MGWVGGIIVLAVLLVVWAVVGVIKMIMSIDGSV